MIDIPLLREIATIPGAPGFEQPIRARVIELVTPLADEVRVDNMGNVIAIKKGKSDKRVMVGAHLDEIGFIVTYIDDDGFVRFHTLGGFDPKTLTAQRVIIHGKKPLTGVMGTKPIHIMKPEERAKVVPTNEYFIDLGMPKSEVEKYIKIGDPITRHGELIEMGDCVVSKSLDNRLSVFILLETFKALQGKDIPHDLYGVFTVQEEVGLRGAISAAGHIDPDFGFGLDVTIAFDVPGSNGHDRVTTLGKGTAIKIMDGSVISDYRMVNYMKEVANRHDIPWQPEILPAGGTDTAGIQRSGPKGSIAGAISIPLRHIHQSIETANQSDVKYSIDLLTACLSELDQFDWSFR